MPSSPLTTITCCSAHRHPRSLRIRFLHDNLPYKPDDLVPIARISNTLIAISVPASMNVASFGDLIALARAEPGKLDWAGVTGAHEFVFSGWLKRMDINMVEVPYRNPVDAANDLAQDRVQVFSSALAIVRPQIEAGKIKLLAMANTVRAPSEPDVPTLREAGYPSLTLDGLVGLFGPPGMPIELRERITADIRAVADSTVADRLALTGQIMNIGGPEEFAKSVNEQRAEVAAFAAELGIKPLGRAIKTATYGLLTSVCTLIAICHWPLRLTQTRVARYGGRESSGET
jgi:tripartite-type tricarboxylate transporter receptor subunit TctC